MEGMSWVHISDIHIGFREEDILKRALANLVVDIEVCSNYSMRPSFILVTGDLTFSGTKSQFSIFNALIDSFPDWLKNLPIVTIPGNHDINRPDVKDCKAHKWLESLGTSVPHEFCIRGAQVKEVLSTHSGTVERKQIDSMFREYHTFWKESILPKLTKSGYVKEGLLPGDSLFIPNQTPIKLAFACLNSAWGQYKKGMFKKNLSILPDQVNNLLPKGFDNEYNDNHVRVFLQHHPPSWLSHFRHWKNYTVNGSHVVLFGHLHRHYSMTRRVNDEDELSVIQACSLYGREKCATGVVKRRLGYSFTSLLQKGQYVEVRKFPRKADENLRFGPARGSGQDVKSGVLVKLIRMARPGKRVTLCAGPEDRTNQTIGVQQVREKNSVRESFIYPELKNLTKDVKKRSTFDRTQFQLVVAGWEAVCSITNRYKGSSRQVDPKDEMLLNLLAKFVLREEGARIEASGKKVLNSYRKHEKLGDDITIGLIDVISEFQMSRDRVKQASVLITIGEKLLAKPSHRNLNELSLLWAPCAINAAIRSNSDIERKVLLRNVKLLLTARTEPIAYHFVGLAVKVEKDAGYQTEYPTIWQKIDSAPYTICFIGYFSEKLRKLNDEVRINNEFNMELIRFEKFSRVMLRKKLVERFGNLIEYMPSERESHFAGENNARMFVKTSMMHVPYIVDSVARILEDNRVENERHLLFQVSEKIVEYIDNRQSTHLSEDLKNQFDLHKSQALWLLGRMDRIKELRVGGQPAHEFVLLAEDKYVGYLTNNYWTPEQVLLDYCHTFHLIAPRDSKLHRWMLKGKLPHV